MGPVEQALRSRMRGGASLSRREAVRDLGVLAGVFYDRLVKAGAVVVTGDRATLREWQPDPDLLARQKRERERLAEVARRVEEARAQAQRQREERARKYAIERALFAGLHGYSQEERAVVIAERIAALADSQPAAEPPQQVEELADVG